MEINEEKIRKKKTIFVFSIEKCLCLIKIPDNVVSSSFLHSTNKKKKKFAKSDYLSCCQKVRN